MNASEGAQGRFHHCDLNPNDSETVAGCSAIFFFFFVAYYTYLCAFHNFKVLTKTLGRTKLSVNELKN